MAPTPTGAGRPIRYRVIAEELRAQLAAGEWGAGELLPSEAELSEHFAASRVTVRRALEELRREHLVDSRQGLGWFVADDPLRQSLGRLGTIEAQLVAQDRISERQVVGFAFGAAPPEVAETLGVDQVLEVRRRNLADGRPFARITVWCPESVGREWSRAQVESATFYELLEADGVELGGAVQTIAARLAGDDDALDLEVPAGSPVLACRRVTTDGAGHPILMSEHVFPAHRTEFVVELPRAGASMAPRGLRLVQ